MTPQQEQELLEQISHLRYDIRNLRIWILFIASAIGIGILLLAPELGVLFERLAVFITGNTFFASVISILVFFTLAALVVAHFSRPNPSSNESESKKAEMFRS